MKLSDFFKKIGIDLETEVDDTSKETSKESDVDKNLLDVVENENTENKDSTDSKKVEEVKKMTLPKYNEKTGLFDLAGIEDEELKAVLKKANDTVKYNNDKRLIDSALKEKIGSVKLKDGITSDVVTKLLDVSNIKVDGDKVIGLDEAFDNLKTSQAGLFQVDKVEQSNPLLEGHNPVQGTPAGYTPNSFAEALAMSGQKII